MVISNNSFVKFMVNKMGRHNMTMLHPNSRYKEICYKETARYYEYSIHVSVSKYLSETSLNLSQRELTRYRSRASSVR